LGLLPIITEFIATKQVRQVQARWRSGAAINKVNDKWMTYEIHMGVTKLVDHDLGELIKPLLQVQGEHDQELHDEGLQSDRVWGSYLHGLFESAQVRQALTRLANISEHRVDPIPWQEHQLNLYNSMADLLEANLDLTSVCRYLDI
jgi:adenosylcobyric acid synthase